MLAAHFSRFRAADPGRLHFAAHSHHPWPDATEGAHAQAWKDSARLVDRKWDKVFAEVVPKAQAHVARLLSLSDARQVAFAPNTHEFVARLYSCFDPGKPLRVLTGASEFHSFRRSFTHFKNIHTVNFATRNSEWLTPMVELAASAGALD